MFDNTDEPLLFNGKENITVNSRMAIPTVVALCVLLMTAATVVHAQFIPNSTPPDIQKAVLARLAEIQNAAQALDPDKVFSYVLENDSGSLAQNGKLFLTRAEALESTRQGFQGIQKVGYRFDGQHVTLLSPGVALVTGEGASFATTDYGRTRSTRFAQTVIMVLMNGEWKMLHAHRSFPPAN
jgi:hypothetical protein